MKESLFRQMFGFTTAPQSQCVGSKYNENHDDRGEFSSGGGGGASAHAAQNVHNHLAKTMPKGFAPTQSKGSAYKMVSHARAVALAQSFSSSTGLKWASEKLGSSFIVSTSHSGEKFYAK